jgi:cell division inhibitor SulA
VAVYQGFLLARESHYLAALAVVFLLAPLAFQLIQTGMVLLLLAPDQKWTNCRIKSGIMG